jgi:hypothetical protein
MLEPDRDQLEQFCEALLRHAGKDGFVSVRAFYEGNANEKFRISGTPLKGGLRFLFDVVEDDARRAAQAPRPAVFCPPLCTFTNKERAREQDICEGLVLTVECDKHPRAALDKLQAILGPATCVIASGGLWINGSDEPEPKLHGHWRLRRPATNKDELAKLKAARELAARLVGGDPSNTPINHPIRWPGSWHRKAEPRLCEIATLNPDIEIDLDATLAALKATTPKESPKADTPGNGADHSAGSDDWPTLIGDIVSGRRFHHSLVSLSARLVGSDMHDGTAVKLLRALMQASTTEHDAFRWQTRYDSIPRIVSSAREKFAKPEPREPTGKPLLRPYEGRDFAAIPRRRWLHAGHYIRQEVVMTCAPGGYGKTSLIICNALEMTTGRGLIGPAPPAGPLRVAYWNAEDPDEEIERRIAAGCLRHDIDQTFLRGKLFLGSRLTGKRRIASLNRDSNVEFDSAMLGEIEQLIGELKIDCVIFDPLIAFHRIPEGDNTLMEQVIKDGFGELALRADICIELSQHTRKSTQGRQGDLTADDSRGAGAIVNAARSVRILNRMTAEEAELPKIATEERRHYLRVARDKTNLAPPGKAMWVHLVSISLPNGDELQPGDQVQAVETWNYPQPFDGVTADDMRWVREEVCRRDYRNDARSPDWIGYPLARRLELDPEGDRKKLNAILRGWIANGVLAIENRPDKAHRHQREYVIPGEWSEGE